MEVKGNSAISMWTMWFSNGSKNIQISALLLQEKVLDGSKETKQEDFLASNGWAEKFRV